MFADASEVRRRRRLGWPALIGLALGASAAAATTLGSCLLADFDRGEVVAVGGAGGAGGAGGSGGAGACQLAGFPPPPSSSGGGADTFFTVAVRSIALSTELVGLDLDGLCTCVDEAGPSCTPTADALSAMSYCDGPGGRDNALAKALEPIRVAHQVADLGVFYSEAADRGDWSLLIEVAGWSGGDDDDEVRVALYPTLPFATVGPPPSWDGDDLWPILDSAVLGQGGGTPEPRYVDDAGYVSGGVLVAHLDSAELRIDSSDGTFSLMLSQVGLMAQIVDTAQGPALEGGKLTTVMPSDHVFDMWGSFRRQNGGAFCTDDPLYGPTRGLLCNAQDMRTGGVAPNQPCNALSGGIDFAAYPAKIGQPDAAPALTDPCAPGASPNDDSCVPP